MQNSIYFNEDFFEVIDTEEKAYWLGFIAADGCVYERGPHKERLGFSMSLAEKDYNHLLKFKESLYINQLPHKRKRALFGPELISYFYQLSSTKLCIDLVNKGITPRKSLILEPPKNVPGELVHHWVRGYFDGDGCVSDSKNTLSNLQISCMGTIKVLEFIIKVSGIETQVRNSNSRAFRFVTSKYSNIQRFYNNIMKDSIIFLDRKKNKFEAFKGL